MSVERRAQRAAPAPARPRRDPADADDPPTGAPTATGSSPARRSLELVPALAAREPTSGYLFYDCQTDDAGSC